ncbi:MAG: PH domain-containing protein [Alphaproteobacteria bacterium]|nr:PH domain-containing protein [Alphaproteobacteria bacterium]
MGYIDENLMPNEIVAARARVHWFIFAMPAFIVALAILLFVPMGPQALLFVLLSLPFALYAFFLYIATELAITNKRVIAKYGFILRKTFELNLSRVESLNIDQSIMGRLLDFGDVTVNGVGTGATPFRCIAAPLALRRALHEALDKKDGTN